MFLLFKTSCIKLAMCILITNRYIFIFVLFQSVFKKLLPLYYPRSEGEEKACLPLIPADIGNSEGEPVVPERRIRITEKPGSIEGAAFFFFFFLNNVMNNFLKSERDTQHASLSFQSKTNKTFLPCSLNL